MGRLLPWFAVAYGAGIVLYFTAEREPALWAAGSLTALCALAAVLLRRQIVPYVVALGAFGIALGFTGATIKTALIDHPVLRFATSGVTVAGFVELREEKVGAWTTSRCGCGFRSSAAPRRPRRGQSLARPAVATARTRQRTRIGFAAISITYIRRV